MPWRLKKVDGGYKVCLVRDPNKTFSNEPLSHDMAEKQIESSEHKTPVEPKVLKTQRVGGAGVGRPGTLGLSDYLKSPKYKSLSFHKQLESIQINPDDYLTTVKHLAAKYKYDPEKISFSDDGKHKILYDSEKGLVRFGAVGYGDYIIYKYLEKHGKVPKGVADKKRQTFVKSHKAMVKDYGVTTLSPNTMAIRILWDSF